MENSTHPNWSSNTKNVLFAIETASLRFSNTMGSPGITTLLKEP
jgi:hypothetical protein